MLRHSNVVKISVVITNYNYSKYLNRAIRSVFVQHFPYDPKGSIEIIVIDDCSTDWSHEIIESYGSFVKPIYLKENNGLAKARNNGIINAEGEYVVFVDADDYIDRHMLFIQWMFLEYNPSWGAAATDYFIVDSLENKLERKSCEEEPIACGIMYRKKDLLEVGMFDEDFRMHEDKDFRKRFLKGHSIHRIELALYRYRRHGSNLTSNQEMDRRYLKRLKDKHGVDD